MGYKSRSNFAPCYSMTDEQFNKIFKKDEKIENKNIQKNIDYVDPLYIGKKPFGTYNFAPEEVVGNNLRRLK